MAWLSTILASLRKRSLLGMSLTDWARFAVERPRAARELLISVADVLEATGNRLLRKAKDVGPMTKRGMRLERRGLQRIDLAYASRRHAKDLLLWAQGDKHLCSADPARAPLEGL